MPLINHFIDSAQAPQNAAGNMATSNLRQLLTTQQLIAPRIQTSQSSIRNPATYCSICMHDIKREDIAETVGCTNANVHQFHQPCLRRWLSNSLTCPVDQQDADTYTTNKIKQALENSSGTMHFIEKAKLNNLNLKYFNFNHHTFKQTKFSYSTLEAGHLYNAYFKGGKYKHASFEKTLLSNSIFGNCHFKHTDLSQAKCFGTQFNQCRFENAGFSDTQFICAVFRQCTFPNTDFKKANFTGTFFEQCLFTRQQYDYLQQQYPSAILQSCQLHNNRHQPDIFNSNLTENLIPVLQKTPPHCTSLDDLINADMPIALSIEESLSQLDQSSIPEELHLIHQEFAKQSIPFGCLGALLELKQFKTFSFIVEHSQELQTQSFGRSNITLAQALQNNLKELIALVSLLPERNIEVHFLGDNKTLQLSSRLMLNESSRKNILEEFEQCLQSDFNESATLSGFDHQLANQILSRQTTDTAVFILGKIHTSGSESQRHSQQLLNHNQTFVTLVNFGVKPSEHTDLDYKNTCNATIISDYISTARLLATQEQPSFYYSPSFYYPPGLHNIRILMGGAAQDFFNPIESGEQLNASALSSIYGLLPQS